MPFNGSGTYSPPVADFPAVSGTLIQASKFNNNINDIAAAISSCITKDGQTTLTANIPFGGFAATNVRIRAIDGAAGTPAVTFENDTASGMYSQATGDWSISADAVRVQQFTTDGTKFHKPIGVGTDPSTSTTVRISGAVNAAGADQRGISMEGTFSSAALTTAYGVNVDITMAAGAGATYAVVSAFHASNAAKDAADTITEQNGFDCGTLTVGAANYGFRGRVASAANRFNLYMSGSADNVLNGNTRIGSTVAPTVALDVTGKVQITDIASIGSTVNSSASLQISGSALSTQANQMGVRVSSTWGAGGTTLLMGFQAIPTLPDTGGNVAWSVHSGFRYSDVTKTRAGDTLAENIGFDCVNLTVGTLMAGFRSTVNSGAGKWGFYASGTADNAFAGNVRIGSVVAPTVALDVTGAIALSGRMLLSQPAGNIASANNLALGTGGNRFRITGAVQINLIDSASWQGGAIITLHFTGAPTVKHNQATSGTNHPIMLAGAVDFVASANDQLTLQYDSVDSKWMEISRVII